MLEAEILLSDNFHLINEEFHALELSPDELDQLLAAGWRHFGTRFFRYSIGFYQHEIRRVIPLRIRLADLSLSKSLRRIINKNRDLQTVIGPAEITSEKEDLFERHKQRFSFGVPETIFDFLSFSPADVPVQTNEVCIYSGDRLLAASFFDVGSEAASGIYAMFDPLESSRSLGILTMLVEIEFARASGKKFYYQGYCYEGASFYDYKRRFRASEKYDWDGNWSEL